MTNYAQHSTRVAYLSEQFGYDIAVKYFGQDEIDKLPKYVRGKNAGKPKGVYEWTRVTRGGWVKQFHHPNGGYVENRVNTVIERRLCHLASSRHGKGTGDAIHILSGSQTLMQQRDALKQRQIEHHMEQVQTAWTGYRKHKELLVQIDDALKDVSKFESKQIDALYSTRKMWRTEAAEHLLDYREANRQLKAAKESA